MPVTVVDIRPLKSSVDGLTFVQDDATELARFPTGSVHSLSSLHAAEHFGLGRYSDPIDPDACFKFMKALERVLAPNGRLYFSVPVAGTSGVQREQGIRAADHSGELSGPPTCILFGGRR